MKYIVFTDSHELATPILFPDFVQHSNIANMIHESRGWNPVSAGFVDIGLGAVVNILGKSESLNLSSHELDSAYIRRAFHLR